jgi:hypothetical protein
MMTITGMGLTGHILSDFCGKSGAVGSLPSSRISRKKRQNMARPKGFSINRPLKAALSLQRGTPYAADKALLLNDLCKIKPMPIIVIIP